MFILNWPERIKTQPHDDRDNCFLPFDSKGPCGMTGNNDIDDDSATKHSNSHTGRGPGNRILCVSGLVHNRVWRTSPKNVGCESDTRKQNSRAGNETRKPEEAERWDVGAGQARARETPS